MNTDTLKITGIDGHTELRLTPGRHRTAHLEILAPGDRVRGLSVKLETGDLDRLSHILRRREVPDDPDIQVISHVDSPTYITWQYEGRLLRVSVRQSSGLLQRSVHLSSEDIRRLAYGLGNLYTFGDVFA